jgi:hypothetical protein
MLRALTLLAILCSGCANEAPDKITERDLAVLAATLEVMCRSPIEGHIVLSDAPLESASHRNAFRLPVGRRSAGAMRWPHREICLQVRVVDDARGNPKRLANPALRTHFALLITRHQT